MKSLGCQLYYFVELHPYQKCYVYETGLQYSTSTVHTQFWYTDACMHTLHPNGVCAHGLLFISFFFPAGITEFPSYADQNWWCNSKKWLDQCIKFAASNALTETAIVIVWVPHAHTHRHMHKLIIHRVENMKRAESGGALKPFGYKTTKFITM